MSFKTLSLTTVLTFCLSLFVRASEPDSYESKRNKMVEDQIIRRGVTDKNVLSAMRKVKRHLFVPAQNQTYAYEDHPLPIGYDQTISQPFIVAFMTEAARVDKNSRVLEIGTGCGYQAAVLGEIAREVYTIEIVEPLARAARELLKALGYNNIFVKHGDGYQGWPEHSPFDAIIVTAAPDEIPQELVNQLKVGGRMVIPVGSPVDNQELYVITKKEEGIEKKSVFPVRFVPMVK